VIPLLGSCPDEFCDESPISRVNASGGSFEVRTPQFIGLQFDTPTRVSLEAWPVSSNGRLVMSNLLIDNVAIKAAPVPEPTLTVLALLGGGGLGAARWISRRRRAVQGPPLLRATIPRRLRWVDRFEEGGTGTLRFLS
jgi:hypothetical protein